MSESKICQEAKDWNEWSESQEGKVALDGSTLNLDPRMQQYLENRVNNAFRAGQKSGKKIAVVNSITKLLEL